MPNIREFSPGALDIRPTETGIEAQAGAARRIGAFYNQASQATDTLGQRVGGAVRDAGDVYVRYEDQKQISQLSLAAAKSENELNRKWQAITLDPNFDPNDESAAGKFKEEQLEPALDKLRNAATTERAQRWIEDHTDRLREHFFIKTTAQMQEMAGIAAVKNIEQEKNVRANNAALEPTPNNVQRQIDEYAAGVKTHIPPNVTGPQAAKLNAHIQEGQTEIVHAAANAAISKAADPEKVARSFAERWPEYVKPQEIDQLTKAATAAKRLNESEARNARVQRDYDARNDFNNKVNALEADTFPKEAGGRPQVPKDAWSRLRDLAANHPGAALEPGRLASMANKLEAITERLNKPEPLGRISHDTTMDLLGQIRDGKLDSDDAIYKAYRTDKLNTTDFNFLRREFADLKTPQGEALGRDRTNFFKNFADTIDPRISGPPTPLGQQRIYEAEMDARRQEEALRKAGHDPHDLYNPKSPYYLGNQINKFRPTLQQQADYAKQLKEDQSRKAEPPKRAIPPGAIQALRYDSSPAARAEFDDHYGKGQSDRILGPP